MLPSPLVSDQQWEARHKLLTSIVQNSWPNQETGQGNASLTSSLAILSDMVANMSNETSQVKKMLFGVLQVRKNYIFLLKNLLKKHHLEPTRALLTQFITARSMTQLDSGDFTNINPMKIRIFETIPIFHLYFINN